MRDILFGGKRHFREFLASEEKIATNILSARLASLVSSGMLTREDDAANKCAAIYQPTQKALALLPVLFELMRWGVVFNPNADTRDPLIRQVLEDPAGLHARTLEKFTGSG